MRDVLPTQAVLLTPPGRGAVATVLVEGNQAVEIVGRLFRPASGRSLESCPAGRILFGEWGHGQGEELVVCRRDDETVEVHCHGGRAAAAVLLDSLAQAGCPSVGWREWFRARASDPIQAQALEALARAPTLRTAAILLDQYQGALGSALAAIADELQGILSTPRARASWPTSGQDVPGGQAYQATTPDAAPPGAACPSVVERIGMLLGRARAGVHLVEPFRVVLAGRPNAGKSSLINALVGYRRSIVYDEAGTTRDVVTARTALAGWPVELADTAGLGPSGDELEAAGVERAQERLAQADVRVLVFDASQEWSGADDAVLAAWPDALVVHNKSDLPPAAGRLRPAGLATSALRGTGIEEVVRELSERLVPDPPPPGAAVPFHPVHVAALELARAEVEQNELALAAAALGAICSRPEDTVS